MNQLVATRPTDLRSVAAQELRTLTLLGVDFIPARRAARQEVDHERVSPDPVPDAEVLRRQALLESLRERHDATCPHCTCAAGHTQLVFGEGSPVTQIMFVGEAPGEEEDRTGRPFVGRAGKKLDDMIRAMGFQREAVYIANILKARPPENRTPLPDEVARCAPFLAAQIRIILPRIIVALGGPASKFLLETSLGITRLRGTWGQYHDAQAGMSIPVMPTYHPAYLLRQYTEENRRKVWSDLQAVLARLAEG